MKNFPHQFADLTRYDKALEVADALSKKKQGFQDNKIFGYALARAKVYRFSRRRAKKRKRIPRNLTLGRRIALEKRKGASDQGAVACGRDVRSVLRHLRLIDSSGLTSRGRQLLKAKPDTLQYLRIWQQAVLNISFRDDRTDRLSHPARIALRMLDRCSALDRKGLALSLEARNDSDAELRRIVRQVPRSRKQEALLQRRFGKTTYTNAQKIIPAFCEQIGFIQRPKRSLPYTLTDFGLRALGLQSLSTVPSDKLTGSVSDGVASYIAYDPRKSKPKKPNSLLRFQSKQEQEEAARLRSDRTVRHECARRLFGCFLEAKNFQLFESSSSFDLLADRGASRPLLVEVKSLERDYIERTRAAVGQLYYYRDVKLEAQWRKRRPYLIAVFDRKLPPTLSKFLDGLDIAAFIAFEHVKPVNRMAHVVLARM